MPGNVARDWEFSRPALDRFLAALHPERDAAAARYEQIRAKLVRFFEWRGCPFPEDHADETITRVIRKIDEGDRIQDPGTYCYGVARLVLLEAVKQRDRERRALAECTLPAPLAADDEIEGRLECLRACLRALPPDHRALIAEYYRYDGPDRIAGRKALAAALGIALNALRIRAHRLSDRLGRCVAHCCRQRGLA
jgi:DNA-directed RNA polymerase specialized sigma24 family protein